MRMNSGTLPDAHARALLSPAIKIILSGTTTPANADAARETCVDAESSTTQ